MILNTLYKLTIKEIEMQFKSFQGLAKIINEFSWHFKNNPAKAQANKINEGNFS